MSLYGTQCTIDYVLNDSIFNLILPVSLTHKATYEPVIPEYDLHNLTKPSGLEPDNINKIIEGTNIEGMGYTFCEAERLYGVNALFLLALTKQESNWGESKFGNDRNNLTGYNAWTNKPSRATVFNSKDESVYQTAKLLSDLYLKPGSTYYNGKSIYAVNVNYCQDRYGNPLESWSSGISSIMEKLGGEIQNNQKVMKIDKKHLKLGDNQP